MSGLLIFLAIVGGSALCGGVCALILLFDQRSSQAAEAPPPDERPGPDSGPTTALLAVLGLGALALQGCGSPSPWQSAADRCPAEIAAVAPALTGAVYVWPELVADRLPAAVELDQPGAPSAAGCTCQAAGPAVCDLHAAFPFSLAWWVWAGAVRSGEVQR